METPEVQGQQVLFYTEDELQAKITEVVNRLTETHQNDVTWQVVRERRNIHDNVYEAVKSMRDEVDEESLVSMYNTIAERCGWLPIEAFTKLYSVSVCYQGTEVAVFTDVEAENEDDAQDKVLEDMNLDDVTISFDISYGNNSDSGEVSISSWDLDTDEFTAEAHEQD
jgi:hypothetical protein